MSNEREPHMSIEKADKFIASLGVEAYRVGGSVRDELLGRRPKDGDYMVRGVSLDDLRKLLAHARVSSLVLRDGQLVGYRVGRPYDIEIALPRKEISTGPGHGDFKIAVDPDLPLEEDAKRRDFTFNALYKPIPSLPVLDPTGRGLHDLERRLIVTTHPDSFRDDPLRILRALRFVARGYELGSTAQTQMQEHAAAVTGLTANGHMSGTVYDEMSKILMGDAPVAALRIARHTGVLSALFPELAPMIGFDQSSKYHDMTTDEHTLKALETAAVVDASLRVRWALLFHDSGKPEAAWIGKDGRKHYYASAEHGTEDHEVVSARLWREAAGRMSGAPKEFVRDVETLIRHHMVPYRSRGVAERTRRMRVQFGHELLHDLLVHRACDLAGKGVSKVSYKHMDQLRDMASYLNDAHARKVPVHTHDLQIDGHDVIDLGARGRKIGDVLRSVLDEVVVRGDEQALTREWQLKRAAAHVR